MKKALFFILVLSAMFLVSACTKSITEISLDQTEARVYLEQQIQLSYTVIPEDAETEGIKWTSSDENVAKIDENGVVLPVSEGSATIMCSTPSGVYATCKIVVEEPIRVGDYVVFGSYEQDNNTSNGAEDIEWLVLDIKNNKALIISRYLLESLPYNEKYVDVTWETCSLRNWLNTSFYNNAFTENERSMITEITVTDDPHSDMYDNYKDKIFLLNWLQVIGFNDVSEEWLKCSPTPYAADKDSGRGVIGYYSNGNGCWWLAYAGKAKETHWVDNDGEWHLGGAEVNEKQVGVRPAMWVELGY